MAYMNVKLDKHWSRPAALVACVAAGLLLAGCAPAYGPRGGGYYGGQSQPGYAGAGQCYQGCGVVRDMREVRLNGGSSDGAVLGTVIGAAVGGLLGSKLGRAPAGCGPPCIPWQQGKCVAQRAAEAGRSCRVTGPGSSGRAPLRDTTRRPGQHLASYTTGQRGLRRTMDGCRRDLATRHAQATGNTHCRQVVSTGAWPSAHDADPPVRVRIEAAHAAPDCETARRLGAPGRPRKCCTAKKCFGKARVYITLGYRTSNRLGNVFPRY